MLPILSVNVYLNLAHGRTRVQRIEGELNGIRYKAEEKAELCGAFRRLPDQGATLDLPTWGFNSSPSNDLQKPFVYCKVFA
jgi:hypothetical protein